MTSPFVLRTADVSDLDEIVALEQTSDPHPWSDSLIEEALLNRQNWLFECCESSKWLAG